MFSLICAPINSWVNNGEAGDLGRNRAHYDVTVTKHIAPGQNGTQFAEYISKSIFVDELLYFNSHLT